MATGNITIYNGATTPVAKTFKLVSPASGYDTWANWRLQEAAVSAAFPAIAFMTKKPTPTYQKQQLKVRVPYSYVNASTGQTVVTDFPFEMNVEFRMSRDMPEAAKPDAVAYAFNVFKDPQILAAVLNGLVMS